MSDERRPEFAQDWISDAVKTRLYWVLGIAIALFVIFYWPHTSSWDGDGQIDAFPNSGSVKNYRLDSTMTVERNWRGWFRSNGTLEYSDIVGQWPNGGTLELQGCSVIDKERTYCTDQDGKGYGVEVVSAPDEPPADDEPSDY